jgi:hypothetical protein
MKWKLAFLLVRTETKFAKIEPSLTKPVASTVKNYSPSHLPAFLSAPRPPECQKGLKSTAEKNSIP